MVMGIRQQAGESSHQPAPGANTRVELKGPSLNTKPPTSSSDRIVSERAADGHSYLVPPEPDHLTIPSPPRALLNLSLQARQVATARASVPATTSRPSTIAFCIRHLDRDVPSGRGRECHPSITGSPARLARLEQSGTKRTLNV
jgi:hypothetical protein